MTPQQPTFSISSVVDPTEGAMKAIAEARKGLSDIIDIYAADEELAQRKEIADKNYALAKAQEDRQSAEWNQKQKDRTANMAFLDALSKADKYQYTDITGEVTKSPENQAKVNAMAIPERLMKDPKELTSEERKELSDIEAQQAKWGEDLVNASRVELTEADRIRNILKNSNYITPEMYSALETAKKEEEALSTIKSQKIAEQIKSIEDYKRELQKANADDAVLEREHYFNKGSSSNTNNNNTIGKGWAKETSVEDVLDDMSILGWGGDTDTATRLATLAVAKGLNKDEFINMMIGGTTETEKSHSWFKDNKFVDPITGKPDEGKYVAEKIDELAKIKAAANMSNSGGFYNKKDASPAITYRNVLIADAQKSIAALRAIDPTPKTLEEKEQLAREQINSVLGRGLEITPKQDNTKVKSITKEAITPPKGAKEATTPPNDAKEETKTSEITDVPLTAPVMPNYRDFDRTTKEGQKKYAEAMREYGIANEKYIKAAKVAEQKAFAEAYKERVVNAAKKELYNLPDLYNKGEISIDEYKARKKELEKIAGGRLTRIDKEKYKATTVESIPNQTIPQTSISTSKEDLRTPIDKVSIDELKRLDENSLVRILQRKDLSRDTRRKVAAVLNGPRGRPSPVQGPDETVFRILQSPMTREKKMSALRSAGVPTAQIQQLLD